MMMCKAGIETLPGLFPLMALCEMKDDACQSLEAS